METSPRDLARLYKSMLLIRRVEEFIASIYPTDAVKSPVHLSIGQESVAVGVCDALAPDDLVSNTYRCHATYLAKGGDLNAMMAELYGKRDGCAGGKAGSMHLVDMQHGVVGASAVVGTTVPVAAGYALAFRKDVKNGKEAKVIAAFFGDGATEEGCVPETLNFASLHKLPILFICENNKLAIHSKIEGRWAKQDSLRARVETYGIPTHYIPDGDVLNIRETTAQCIGRIRKGGGPEFIECATYRWMEHVGPTDDHHEGYRDKKEFERWKANDQIARLEKLLGAEAAKIQAEVEREIKAAAAFAEKSPYPGEDALLWGTYAA
jgi:pyruvate dehydrogenase E1 component alpha subunit